jgi:hypothetical protein
MNDSLSTEKPKLPALIWVIGILGILVGGWNGLIGSVASIIALTSPPPEPGTDLTLIQTPYAKVILPIGATWGLLILGSSIGLLFRRNIGRLGVMVMAILSLFGFIAYGLFVGLIVGHGWISVFIGLFIGIFIVGIPAGLIVYYLSRAEIKRIYNANKAG